MRRGGSFRPPDGGDDVTERNLVDSITVLQREGGSKYKQKTHRSENVKGLEIQSMARDAAVECGANAGDRFRNARKGFVRAMITIRLKNASPGVDSEDVG